MKLADAIAQDLPFQLELPGGSGPYPIAWLWQLRGGGVAFVFAGYRRSPSASRTCTAVRSRARVRG
jgi:hypothetical protein